jgi:hypothetical protein
LHLASRAWNDGTRCMSSNACTESGHKSCVTSEVERSGSTESAKA